MNDNETISFQTRLILVAEWKSIILLFVNYKPLLFEYFISESQECWTVGVYVRTIASNLAYRRLEFIKQQQKSQPNKSQPNKRKCWKENKRFLRRWIGNYFYFCLQVYVCIYLFESERHLTNETLNKWKQFFIVQTEEVNIKHTYTFCLTWRLFWRLFFFLIYLEIANYTMRVLRRSLSTLSGACKRWRKKYQQTPFRFEALNHDYTACSNEYFRRVIWMCERVIESKRKRKRGKKKFNFVFNLLEIYFRECVEAQRIVVTPRDHFIQAARWAWKITTCTM